MINSIPDKVLFFKQCMYGMNVLRLCLLVFWMILNRVIYYIIKKKSPEISAPSKTLFPFGIVNTIICILNVSAASAGGIILTIKENAYVYCGLDGSTILPYLQELNGIANQIWYLLIIEIFITIITLVFGRLSAKQALQRISFCVASFLPFIICTIPIIW